MKRLIFFLMAIVAMAHVCGQPEPETVFTPEGAREFVKGFTGNSRAWRSKKAWLRSDLERLYDHAVEPIDSVEQRIAAFDFASVGVSVMDLLVRDSLELRWLNDSTFILDSMGRNDSVTSIAGMPDSVPRQYLSPDTVWATRIDTAALEALGVPMYRYAHNRISPDPAVPGKRRSARITGDSAFLVFTDTLSLWVADADSPFRYVGGEHQIDSLRLAVETLLRYTERRDSTKLVINDMYGDKTPFWLTTGKDDFYRFWVKNYKNDSITLWIGNPAKNEISLLLEDAIDVNRLTKVETGYIPVKIREPDRSLEPMVLLQPEPVSWEYDLSSAFTFNQTYLSHWSKGGENSLSSMLDISGAATYTNREAKTQWISEARIKFGTVITEEYGLRKNTDQLELSSQFNKNARGKFDLSAVFYMKNQIAKGYNYPNDSVVVSKFLNPASLTVGLGVEYKPFTHTSINMAPLSYKNTFVLDTARIDQTLHGIKENKRAKQEMGTQLVVKNKISPMEDMTIYNSVRLFSNYLNKPQNVDVDWEMILDQKISWFFTVRLNLHLIYDDDVRFPVYGSNDQPVLLPDGSEKKSPKAQFKEFVGLSLLFKF
jgi:hypothetical protein